MSIEQLGQTREPHSALVLSGLTKSFGASPVLDGFDLVVGRGEIHALVGENGSGKSTCIKILSGFHAPDAGAVDIGGHSLTFASPGSAYALGCRFVHQDLGLVQSASVLDNMSFGSGFPTRWGTIRSSEARRLVERDLATVGLDIDPMGLIGGLAPAVKTGVAVARALRNDEQAPVTVLVLDEPTATLPMSEVETLLSVVRAAAANGVAVLYVSHHLGEVLELADNVTVLRDGRKVITRATAGLDRRGLVTLLVGSELEEVKAASDAIAHDQQTPVLRAKDLASGPLASFTFDVRPGEIVGIAGVTGSGRDAVLPAIFGAAPRDGGEIEVNGVQVPPVRPDLAMAAGVGYLPSNRPVQGAMLDLTARENLAISDLRMFWRRLSLRRKLEIPEVRRWFDRLNVKPSSGLERRMGTFSGGNQQKVVFGKWLRRNPVVLLLEEPTQGVDIGVKMELHRQILAAAEAGAAIVISTSDTDELVALAHRVLVIRDGYFTTELRGADVTITAVSHLSLGSEAVTI